MQIPSCGQTKQNRILQFSLCSYIKCYIYYSYQKLSYKEKIELEELEKELDEKEGRKEEINGLFSSGELDGDQANELSIELGQLVDRIEEITLRWMELVEKQESWALYPE